MPNKAFELKYPHEGGVLVVAVEKGSPAEKSGSETR
jgi:S1-C subfamily serine protease